MKRFMTLLTGLLLTIVVQGAFAASAGPTRTDSSGGVTVKVTPLPAEATDDIRFQVVLDTHSVNLGAYDLKTAALLRDDSGNTYPPVRVENKGSGHHREVTVFFPKVASAKRLEMIIKGIAGVDERSFAWDR